MSRKTELTRRRFLRASAMTAVGILAASCAQPTPQVIEKEVPVEKVVKETVLVEKQVPVEKVVKETVVVQKEIAVEKVVTATPLPAKYQEAPQLAELVKAGKLPPVDERLPDEPLVVEPNDKIGKYGGDYNQVFRGPQDTNFGFERMNNYEPLIRWNVPWTAIVPGVAKSWEVNETGTEYTFSFRKGMRWSDGEPFTADDVLFWHEQLSNKELNPTFPKKYSTKGGPCTLTKIDHYTVKFTFPDPYGLFPILLPGRFDGFLYAPAHFNKQFFPGYTSDEILKQKAKATGVDNWFQAYGTWTTPWLNPDAPTITPWKYVTKVGDAPQYILERNPYYWKVDPEGKQLPYCDRFVSKLVASQDAAVMAAAAGEIAYMKHIISELRNKPLYVENMEKGDFHIIESIFPGGGDCTLNLNLTHKDPVMRELFQNKDFRIGLSHAINRDEVVDLANSGVGTGCQAAPLPESSFYDKEMETQYTEYDPTLAASILDKVLPNKDTEGFRLRPDGKPLLIVASIHADRQNHIDVLTLVKKYWEDVGVKLELKIEEATLVGQRRSANEYDLYPWFTDAALDYDLLMMPQYYFCVGTDANFGPAWGAWYSSGGTQGEEPPAAMRRQMELYDALVVTADAEGQRKNLAEILKIAKEQFWCIGTYRGNVRLAVCKNKFKNVPEGHYGGWSYPDPGPLNPCQFFWDV